MKRKLLQLEIEQVALKKEKDSKSKERLRDCKIDIQKLKGELKKVVKVWEKEKEDVDKLSRVKEKLEHSKFKMDHFNKVGDFDKAAEYKYKIIPEFQDELDKRLSVLEKNKFVKLEVTTEDIADVISTWTGIPVNKMLEGEKEKLLHLEHQLNKRVVGQDDALKKTSDVIRMSKMGVTDADRPIGSFLFMGSTGVGKTELAKTLAEALFDNEKSLVRVDMSELMESHSVSKLIGSPPGYVGYDEGGNLTEKVRRRPYSVILFDEIEKAHPSVLNILLQLLDDGRLTDSKGRTVNFKNTIIIMTTNLSESDLKISLKPELINRIDEIICFNDLGVEVVSEIIDIHITDMIENIEKNNVECFVDNSVKEYLIKNGYKPEFGARPVKRLIRRDILSEVSRYMLENPDTKTINIDYDNKITINQNSLRLTEAS